MSTWMQRMTTADHRPRLYELVFLSFALFSVIMPCFRPRQIVDLPVYPSTLQMACDSSAIISTVFCLQGFFTQKSAISIVHVAFVYYHYFALSLV
jgi:hypothetical protein